MTVDVRQLRNERIFRAGNEATRQNRPSPPDTLLDFLCECSDLNCTTNIELTGDEYALLRCHSHRFAVANGHESAVGERVLDQFSRFTVVQK